MQLKESKSDKNNNSFSYNKTSKNNINNKNEKNIPKRKSNFIFPEQKTKPIELYYEFEEFGQVKELENEIKEINNRPLTDRDNKFGKYNNKSRQNKFIFPKNEYLNRFTYEEKKAKDLNKSSVTINNLTSRPFHQKTLNEDPLKMNFSDFLTFSKEPKNQTNNNLL